MFLYNKNWGIVVGLNQKKNIKEVQTERNDPRQKHENFRDNEYYQKKKICG